MAEGGEEGWGELGRVVSFEGLYLFLFFPTKIPFTQRVRKPIWHFCQVTNTFIPTICLVSEEMTIGSVSYPMRSIVK